MTDGTKISCQVARDLLTPWLAGDVSPGTRAWLEQHLSECQECGAAAEEARSHVLRGATSADSRMRSQGADADAVGRRLLARVRRRQQIILGIMVLLLVAGAAAAVWGTASIHAWASMPVAQPVPVGDITPEQAAAVDLSHLGLTADGVTTTEHGVAASWRDASGNRARVDLMRFDTKDAARKMFSGWERSYSVKIMSITMNTSLGRTAKFRSSDSYLYGWQTDDWFIAITVPRRVSEPLAIRDGIRDALLESFLRGK